MNSHLSDKVYLALMAEKPKMDEIDQWAVDDKAKTSGEDYVKATAAKAKCNREAKKAEEDEKAEED